MIPLELVLQIIEAVRQDAIQMVSNPVGRDAFAYGQAHGWMQAADALLQRINQAVETTNRNSEREDSNDNSGKEEDEYQL